MSDVLSLEAQQKNEEQESRVDDSQYAEPSATASDNGLVPTCGKCRSLGPLAPCDECYYSK